MKWLTSGVRRLGQWVRQLPPRKARLLFVILVMALAVISFGTFYSLRFYNYVQSDPNFCRSCHLMESSWDRWATSAHKDIECHSCHEQSALAGAQQILGFALGRYERVESHAVVPDPACKKCHESGSPGWLQVAATAGHRVHAEEQNVACVKCHSVTVHRFQAPGPICNVCHEEKHTEISGMAPMHCTACHRFLAAEEQLLPRRRDCLDCHRTLIEPGVTWPADAPMQYPCGDCHQPHQQARPIVDCLSCHSVEGLHLKGAHGASLCQACHQPHEWQVTRRETCLTCHPGQAAHNTGILCSNCHSFPGK